jgi:hypothetical protein
MLTGLSQRCLLALQTPHRDPRAGSGVHRCITTDRARVEGRDFSAEVVARDQPPCRGANLPRQGVPAVIYNASMTSLPRCSNQIPRYGIGATSMIRSPLPSRPWTTRADGSLS